MRKVFQTCAAGPVVAKDWDSEPSGMLEFHYCELCNLLNVLRNRHVAVNITVRQIPSMRMVLDFVAATGCVRFESQRNAESGFELVHRLNILRKDATFAAIQGG